jgi:hypothetical protein
MSLDPQHLAHLKTLYPDAEVMPEGGIDHIYFPVLPIETNGTVLKMKALLRLGEHQGYATRLFVERQIAGKGQNWNCFQLLGNAWWAPSWNHVTLDLPLLAILANHLTVFR